MVCFSVVVDDLEWDGEMLEFNEGDNCFFQGYRVLWDLYNCNGGVLSWIYFELELYYFMFYELEFYEEECCLDYQKFLDYELEFEECCCILIDFV